MKTIWKYDIPLNDRFILKMPKDAFLLSVDNQNEAGCLWALVDPDEAMEDRNFRLYGTGHPIVEDYYALHFIGTFQQRGGLLIWHLFEYGYKTVASED